MIKKELEKIKNLIANLTEHESFNSYLSSQINKKNLKKEFLLMMFDVFRLETEIMQNQNKISDDRYKVIVELFYTYKLFCDELVEDYTKYTINKMVVNN